MTYMKSPKPVTVSKKATSRALRSAVSSTSVRVTPMTGAQRRVASNASKKK